METITLEPEFYVDFDGIPRFGTVTIAGDKIIDIGAKTDQRGQKISLKNQVLLPGFVNCHSHVFHRALRGLVEKPSAGDNFFSWREQMYTLAQKLSPDMLRQIALLTYYEMLEAGFTHVGEFHYLHHDHDGKNFSDPLTMSQALSDAARQTGINLCLLECAYQRNHFSQALEPRQQRFGFNELANFLAFALSAKQKLSHKNISVGLAIHSVRAVPEDWFSPINELARNQAMPLHIHVSEQRSEVDLCLKTTNCSPVGLLARHQILAPHTTLVHAIHLTEDDLRQLEFYKPIVCLCPSTEKNLGDGVTHLEPFLKNQIKICLGTDQHVRLDPFCEARSLEETERLRLFRRGIFTEHSPFLYRSLLSCLNYTGKLSLYPRMDHKMKGQAANLVAIELPSEYLWHGPDVALDAIMLSYNSSKISQVITNGQFVVQDKMLLKQQEKNDLIKEINQFIGQIF